MAPLASDPRQLLVTLKLDHRKALYTLVTNITNHMRTQLVLEDVNADDNKSHDAPLFSLTKDTTSSETAGEPDLAPSQRIKPPSPGLVQLRKDAVEHLCTWRKDILAKLREIATTPDDAKVVEARKQRAEHMSVRRQNAGEDMHMELTAAVTKLQSLYHPIPTRLTTMAVEDREEVLSCVLLLLLSLGNYSADSRVLAVYLTSALDLPLGVLVREETEIAKFLIESSTSDDARKQQKHMSAEAEAQKHKTENQSRRYWKVGLASVAGAAIVGVTGGLAAPLVAGALGGLMTTVGLGGVASFLGIFLMDAALVGALFGAYGAKMTGELVDKYAREVKDFRFLPLNEEGDQSELEPADKSARRLRVGICINGFLKNGDELLEPFRCLGPDSEVFALRYEMESLIALGKSLDRLVSSTAWTFVKYEILKRTVLATLWSALWPAYLLSMATSVDNPFSLAKNRSDKAGKILADALINKVQGERPVTLVGYSLGARVIYSCLHSLAERKAFGLIDTVVLIGAPVPSDRNTWQVMRSVVSGKIFNVYSQSDFILGFMYRATSIQLGVAGLQAIQEIEGVENLDLSSEVKGHLRYPELIGRILARCGFPHVKGGDQPIEKEEEEIKLEDIDLDKLAVDDTRVPASTPPTTTKITGEIADP